MSQQVSNEPVADTEPDAGPDTEPGRHGAPGTSPTTNRTTRSPADEIALRLARLHLRMGCSRSHARSWSRRPAVARLDEDALRDLAEVRWRTGDTAGAGEAANVALGRGAEDPLALVIAAESISADGRPGEARRLAARALKGRARSMSSSPACRGA